MSKYDAFNVVALFMDLTDCIVTATRLTIYTASPLLQAKRTILHLVQYLRGLRMAVIFAGRCV